MGNYKLVPIFVLIFQIQLIFCAPPLFEYKEELYHNPETILRNNIEPRVRLPGTVVPLRYDAEIRPILDEGPDGEQFTAPGKISIRIRASANTSSISLHALGLIINNSSITVREALTNTVSEISSFGTDDEREFFIINLNETLESGKEYIIYIEYVAPILQGPHYGLYLSTYKAPNGTIINLAVTDFEAPDARRTFPCFDEPQLKAVWNVSIIRQPKYHSLANTKSVIVGAPVPELPGWLRDTYEDTPAISTYLVCFAVSDFESKAAADGLYSVPVTIWGPPPLMQRGGGEYSPDLSAKLLKFLEDYFEVPAALTKMDKISIPDYTMGAMENWGLNTYRESRLLYIEGLTTIQDKVSMANTISHELVHQWFGNLVTMNWWDDLWLNEGFASFYSQIGVQGVGITDNAPMENLVTSVQTGMQADVLPSTHPLHWTVLTPPELASIFDTIVYSKGGSIVRMMNSFLTEPVMKSALKQYLVEFAYGSPTQDDLFTSMNAVASASNRLPPGRTLKEVMDTWTLQSGFPLVTVTRNTDGSARFDQKKFVIDYIGGPVDNGERWDIPLTYMVQGATFANSNWLLESSLTLPVLGNVNEWVIVNPEKMGYYRVQYDARNLNMIINQLLTNHTAIDETTRSALIDDNLNLAFANMANLTSALTLTTYLKSERNLSPWVAFVTNMAHPYRMFGRTAAFTPFKKYVLGLMVDALNSIGIDPQPGESVANATLLRNRLFEWTCNLGHAPCINYAKEKFTNWTQNPVETSIIQPDLQASVYCTAVANGGDAEWNFALEQYRQAERDPAKLNLIRALGCAKSSFRLNRLLDLALDLNSGLENAHRLTALQAVAGNSAGAEITFNFIRNNFQTLVRRYGVGIFSGTVTTLSNVFSDRFDLADLERFIAANSDALAPVNSALETAKFNINKSITWMERNAVEFRAFMQALP